MIVKMYRVFDKIFMNVEDAAEELGGWEHKEDITVVWVAVHSMAGLPSVIEYDELYDHVLEFGSNIETVTSGYQSIVEMERSK